MNKIKEVNELVEDLVNQYRRHAAGDAARLSCGDSFTESMVLGYLTGFTKYLLYGGTEAQIERLRQRVQELQQQKKR